MGWTLIAVGAGLLVVFVLAFCEVVLWYWKVNEAVGLLHEIRDLLAEARPRLVAVTGENHEGPSIVKWLRRGRGNADIF